MGQKINPISLRLEQTNKQFDSCWFNQYNYTNLINKDIKIKSYINFVLNQIKYSSARFFIQNLPNKIKVHVFFLNPKTLRKSVSRVFKLKDSFKKKRKTKQIKRLNEISFLQKKNEQLLGKNIFLKKYKNNTNTKANLLNYFFLNCSCIYFNKKSFNYPLEKSKNILGETKFSTRCPTGHGKDKINTKIWNVNNENNKSIYTQLFLRYLLLKKFSLKFNQKLETRFFLFFNFINFTLLNNKNKFFLVSNFLDLKVYDYKQYLKNDIRNNKIKFSNLLGASKTNELSKKKKYLQKKKSFGSDAEKTLFEKNKNLTNNAVDSLSALFFLKNLNYFFLSLINKQSLKKIHSYFNKSLKNFDSLQKPFSSCLNISLTNHETKIKLNKHQKIQNANSYKSLMPKSIDNDLIKLVSHDFQILNSFKKKINTLSNLKTAFKNNLALINVTNNTNKKANQLNFILANKSLVASAFAPWSSQIKLGGKTNSIILNKTKVSNTNVLINQIDQRNSFLEGAVVHISEADKDTLKTNNKKFLFLQNSFFKKHLESQITNTFSSDTVLLFFKFSNEKQSAIFLAEEIIYYLEKKVPFFKIKNQLLKEVSKSKNPFLKGLRVTCSGRVGGRSKKAQRAKIQIIKYGQTSLHVFSSKIDFASKYAYTVFGLLGVKVWICYN
jgi:ribosomal protein S3